MHSGGSSPASDHLPEPQLSKCHGCQSNVQNITFHSSFICLFLCKEVKLTMFSRAAASSEKQMLNSHRPPSSGETNKNQKQIVAVDCLCQ